MKRELRVGDMFEITGWSGIWFIITEEGHIRIGEEVTTSDKEHSVFFSRYKLDKATVNNAYTYLGNCLD